MTERPARIFITDCEGPITKNDNAAELAEAFIPEGTNFFRKISLYDDYLAEIVHKQGYKAGDTLKLILPFLKAFGVDNRSIRKFSRRNIEMIPFADRALERIHKMAPSFIVSTSYTPYVEGVCDVIGFPLQYTFSTNVSLDEFPLSTSEKKLIREAHRKILDLPDLTLPQGAKTPGDLSEIDLEVVRALDRFFWTDLLNLGIYSLVESVNPVGGHEKAEAVRYIVKSEDSSVENVIYVGDSITDVEAFRLVKAGGGLAVSFNGNHWAVKESMLAITAANALPIEWVATTFISQGLVGLEYLMIRQVTDLNIDEISDYSSQIRKNVRTEKIGALG
jgi:energy-converting hydrogenase A subunit R